MELSNEELAEARSEFELALLFDKHGLACKDALVRGAEANAMYLNPYIEAAWRGFQMCWERQHDLLDRLDPVRYIGPGLEGAFREISEFDHAEGTGTDPLYIQDVIRSVLTACRSTPV